jgi:putative nucleotidyltransferase with HDIG domain
MAGLIEEARAIAERLMSEELPRRWRHVQAVARTADEVSSAVGPTEHDTLVAAAWLHDIGYVRELVDTGFHPLDGARWLRRHEFDPRVTALVAHHSCALIEADERGLADALTAEFANEGTPTTDALWYSDMTTGPDGQRFEVTERLDEINQRYGPDHVVTRFIRRARPEIVGAVRRTEQRVGRASAASA